MNATTRKPTTSTNKPAAANKPAAEVKTEVTVETKEEVKEYVVNGVKFTTDTPIEFRANPKRPNSQAWSRYEKYQTAKTFGEYLSLNKSKQQMADARYDLGRGFLKLAETKET